MLTTKLFPFLFKKYQKLLIRNQNIQNNVLKKTFNPLAQNHIGNIFALTHLINTQLGDLQSDKVISLVSNFTQKINKTQIKKFSKTQIQQFYYDQQNKNFIIEYAYKFNQKLPQLESFQQIKLLQEKLKKKNQLILEQEDINQSNSFKIKIIIKNCAHQKFDHPSIRKTMYFHELKDVDKILKYEFLPKTPLMVQDMNRKQIQFRYLDQKNPYGIPKNSPPFIFSINLEQLIYFKIKSTYQKTIITQIGKIKDQKIIKKMSAMKIPTKIQSILYKDLLEQALQVTQQTNIMWHKLAYVGGRVEKLSTLIDLHQIYSMEDDSRFQSLLQGQI